MTKTTTFHPLSLVEIASYKNTSSTVLTIAKGPWAIVNSYCWDIVYKLDNTSEADINAVYEQMRKSSSTWMKKTFGDPTEADPKSVVGVVQSIMNHATNNGSRLKGLSGLTAELKKKGSGNVPDEMISACVTIITQIQKEANDIKSHLGNAAAGISNFSEDLGQQKAALQNLDDKYSGQKGVDTEKINALNEELPPLRATIASFMSEYHKYCIAAESSPALLVVPFVGCFLAAADAVVFAGLAAHELHLANEAKGQLSADLNEIHTLNQQIAEINFAIGQNKGVIAAMDTVLSVVESLEGVWGSYVSDINNFVSQVNELWPPSSKGSKDSKHSAEVTQLIVDKYSQDNTVEDAWSKVEKAAQAFSTSAYVTNIS